MAVKEYSTFPKSSGTTTPIQSRIKSNDNEVIFHILQSIELDSSSDAI